MTLSTMSLRASCATARRTVKTIFPAGVAVSIDSLRESKVDFRARGSFERTEASKTKGFIERHNRERTNLGNDRDHVSKLCIELAGFGFLILPSSRLK
jgi:hypothetical protein